MKFDNVINVILSEGIEREVFTVPLGRGTTELIKNPIPEDYARHKEMFKKEFPNAPTAGEVISRFTEDKDDNRYIWYAADVGHAYMEQWIDDNMGIETSQNIDLLLKRRNK